MVVAHGWLTAATAAATSRPTQQQQQNQVAALQQQVRGLAANLSQSAPLSCRQPTPAHARSRLDPQRNEPLQRMQVRYRHALRRLKEAYPGEFCGLPQDDEPRLLVDWTLRVEAMGEPLPLAAREALSALATADDAAAQANLERERALAAVKIDKADVDLVVQELEVDRAVADRELRVQGGDVVKALRALVNA